MHAAQRADKTRPAKIRAELEERKHHKPPERWRRRRWAVLIAVNLLFVLSYQLDIQMLEGALTASRFVGFHMADLNSALQVMLAFKEVLINLLIGTITVLVFWWLLGGRTFCSWVCPYHLVAEWAEMLHVYDTVVGNLPHSHWWLDLPGVYLPAALLVVAGLRLRARQIPAAAQVSSPSRDEP